MRASGLNLRAVLLDHIPESEHLFFSTHQKNEFDRPLCKLEIAELKGLLK